MRKRIGRPSPALVISLIALFAAMGGSGYAAVKLNGSEIKNKTITGKKLKHKTITGGKVKGNTLTGRQIKESSLGTVPRATSATSAASATNAVNATNAANVTGRKRAAKKVAATPGASFDVARAAAPEVPLFTAGPFTIYGKCMTDLSGPGTIGFVFVKTSESNAILNSPVAPLFGAPTFLQPGTDEIQRYLTVASTGANAASWSAPVTDQASGWSQGGVAWEATTQINVKNGTLPGGNGPFGAGDVCLFSGALTQTN